MLERVGDLPYGATVVVEGERIYAPCNDEAAVTSCPGILSGNEISCESRFLFHAALPPLVMSGFED